MCTGLNQWHDKQRGKSCKRKSWAQAKTELQQGLKRTSSRMGKRERKREGERARELERERERTWACTWIHIISIHVCKRRPITIICTYWSWQVAKWLSLLHLIGARLKRGCWRKQRADVIICRTSSFDNTHTHTHTHTHDATCMHMHASMLTHKHTHTHTHIHMQPTYVATYFVVQSYYCMCVDKCIWHLGSSDKSVSILNQLLCTCTRNQQHLIIPNFK